MIHNSKLAALIAIPSGLLITMLFLWLFDIDIATWEHLSEFPANWSFLDLAANGFSIMMFGGSTRAIYRALTGKYDDPSDQDVTL